MMHYGRLSLITLIILQAIVFLMGSPAYGAIPPGSQLPIPSLRLLAHEDQYINRFGSKFGIQFYPHGAGVLPVGLGPRHNKVSPTNGIYAHVFLAVQIKGHRYVLPLIPASQLARTDRRITQYALHRTMTQVDFRSSQYPKGVVVHWKFISPFYPQATRLCTAPMFYVRCQIKNTGTRPMALRILAGFKHSRKTTIMAPNNLIIRKELVHAVFRGPETDKYPKTIPQTLALASDESGRDHLVTQRVDGCDCLVLNITLASGGQITTGFILAQYANTASIVDVLGHRCGYEYQALFPSIESVIGYARKHQSSILARSAIFDNIIAQAAIPQNIKHFIARNFQVYLGATWLLHGANDKPIFTSYEGGTGYFSTVDVEFNLAPFYCMFWPSCLKSELNLWSQEYDRGAHYKPYRTGPRGALIRFGPQYGIMEHDIGGGFIINKQVYMLGPMPVEENSNYILMNDLYYCYTGQLSTFIRHEKLCIALANYILHSSTDGTGLPNHGTNNTLDGFGYIHRNYPDQVFLGLKAACALQAMGSMLISAGHRHTASPYLRRANLIVHSIEAKAWQGNHYAITISPRHPAGWNAPWALTTNGLLYNLLTAQPQPLMPQRVRSDLTSAIDVYTKWPSMGIWRDMIACYFGLYPRTTYDFRPDFIGDMYPRNFNAIAMLQAWGHIGINIPQRRVTIGSHAKGWFPLPALADWNKQVIPRIRVVHGRVQVRGATRLSRRMTFTVVPKD